MRRDPVGSRTSAGGPSIFRFRRFKRCVVIGFNSALSANEISNIKCQESGISLFSGTCKKDLIAIQKGFVNQRIEEKGIESVKHYNEWFDFPVMTRQEKNLTLQFVENIQKSDSNLFKASYVQEALMDYQGSHSLFSQV